MLSLLCCQFCVECTCLSLRLQITVQVLLRLSGRLFSNLMQRSQSISLAMQARGFRDPESHTVHLGGKEHVQLIPNVIAMLALPLTVFGGLYCLPTVL